MSADWFIHKIDRDTRSRYCVSGINESSEPNSRSFTWGVNEIEWDRYEMVDGCIITEAAWRELLRTESRHLQTQHVGEANVATFMKLALEHVESESIRAWATSEHN